MRKSNLALLVAVVVASPLALASGYPQQPQSPSYGGGYGGHHGGYDDNDSSIVDSYNDDITKTATLTYDSDKTITDSFNEDNDDLTMKDINNDKSFKYTDNSDNSKKFHFESNFKHTETWKIDVDENHYMAKSDLKGEVIGNDVTYGGACCDDKDWGHGGGYGNRGYGNGGNHGGGDAGSLTVTHVNDMSGAFAGASGISLAGQNAGNNSLVQQSASTNAVLLGQ
ncbi:hypothetical protein [Photobacterium halotolerans]|uniref:Uncharacterized protein n=1 Tax=Photobacterium halotolerans TaxID=265726 RepID=A0A7X5B0G2_9GAMM|nr:hypothetical protein [Photobacterium halotolerans]NAW66540.1 hypothetical protein [Photobacterium halotolerans]NAW85896.1 hypothetical protein [Photobacterium halotolerans]